MPAEPPVLWQVQGYLVITAALLNEEENIKAISSLAWTTEKNSHA